MTTKQAVATVEADVVTASKVELEEAERHLAELRTEERRLTVEQGVLGRVVTREGVARKQEVYARADQLKGTRFRRGELELAQEAVVAARRRLAEVLDPVLSVAEAERAAAVAERRLVDLAAEQAGIAGLIREAALANDVEQQVQVVRRADELPLLVSAAKRSALQAQLRVARAHVAATTPAEGETPSGEHRKWREQESDLRRRLSDLAADAAAQATTAAAPVVRSAWQA